MRVFPPSTVVSGRKNCWKQPKTYRRVCRKLWIMLQIWDCVASIERKVLEGKKSFTKIVFFSVGLFWFNYTSFLVHYLLAMAKYLSLGNLWGIKVFILLTGLLTGKSGCLWVSECYMAGVSGSCSSLLAQQATPPLTGLHFDDLTPITSHRGYFQNVYVRIWGSSPGGARLLSG